MADAAPAGGIVAEDSGPPKKKGGLLKLLLPLLALVIGVGGGLGVAMFAPQLLPGGAPAASTDDGAAMAQRPRATPRVAPLEYLEIDNNFTSNMRDTGRFIQIRIAVSTHGGKPVLDAVERHRLAIISVVLNELATTTEAQLNAPGGRDDLTRRIRIAINDLLQRKSGIAGIDDVFLTSFVVQ
ncbi:MAG: flagellar basal body-associated protein FliL [Thermaurantiacus sp.]